MKIVKRFLGILSLLTFIAIFVVVAETVYFRDVNPEVIRQDGFHLEQKNSLDMVILGSSEVFCGYNPALGYKKTKLTGYNYAHSENVSTLWKYEIKDILSCQKPEILIIEANGLIGEKKGFTNQSLIKHIANNMIPMLPARMELIKDRVNGAELHDYFPFISNHSKLKRNDYKELLPLWKRNYALLRGSYVHKYRTNIPKPWEESSYKGIKPIKKEAKVSLREILRQCKESNIKHVVFVRFPHLVVNKNTANRYKRYSDVKNIVEKEGFDFIDLDKMKKDMGITAEDFRDPEHLYYTGQKKFSEWLPNFIMKKYDISPRKQTEKNIREWENSVTYVDLFYKYIEDYSKRNPKKIERSDRKNIGLNFSENQALIKSLEEMQ